MFNIKSTLMIVLATSALALTACSKKEPAPTTEASASELVVSEPVASIEQPVSDAEVAPEAQAVPTEQNEAIAALDKPAN